MLPNRPSRPRILVVDDEPSSRSTLASVLEERFDVETAGSAAQARACIEAGEAEDAPFDVVLSDHRMPDETGLSLMRWVAASAPHTLRILVTGFLDAPRIFDAFNDGHIWQFVAKPWKREQLLQLIARGLEYRHSQAAMRRAEQRYRDLFQNAPVGLMRVEPDGTVLEANRAIASSLGLEQLDVLVGDDFGRFVDEASWDALLEELDRRQVVRRREMVLTNTHGRPVHVLLDAIVRTELDGVVVIDLTTLDLTAERSAREKTVALEKQLLRLQKHGAIESFAGGLVHDFNNVISIINTSVGFAGLVLREQDDAEWKAELESCLLDIEHASGEGTALAQQLLTMIREGGTELAALDVSSIAERVVRLLKRGYQGGPRIKALLQPDLPLVYANASQLHQCILNLCLNGLEAMPEGGLLQVITQHEGDTVSIVVVDEGEGIPDSVRAQIFDPYFTTKADDGGTGLGLSVVRAIVAQHDGEVELESTPMEGSRFTLRLPTAEALDRNDAAMASVEGKPHVLIVDADPALSRRVAVSLERLGYRVSTELDPAEALPRYEAEREEIAVVMLDVAMTTAGGSGLVQALRDRAPDLPVVLTTDKAGRRVLSETKLAHRVAVLDKPYRIEEVAEAVHEALGA